MISAKFWSWSDNEADSVEARLCNSFSEADAKIAPGMSSLGSMAAPIGHERLTLSDFRIPGIINTGLFQGGDFYFCRQRPRFDIISQAACSCERVETFKVETFKLLHGILHTTSRPNTCS